MSPCLLVIFFSSYFNCFFFNLFCLLNNVYELLSAGCSDVLRSVFDKDCVASKPHLAAVSNVTLPEPAPASSPIREAETEVMVPDSTNQDSTVQLSPVRQHEDSVPREAQSPPQFNNDDNGMERLREGGYTDYMPSPPPPRFSPSRTDDFTTQTRVWETESYRTEPSTSTYREDLPGPTNSGVSDIPEMVDEVFFSRSSLFCVYHSWLLW